MTDEVESSGPILICQPGECLGQLRAKAEAFESCARAARESTECWSQPNEMQDVLVDLMNSLADNYDEAARQYRQALKDSQ